MRAVQIISIVFAIACSGEVLKAGEIDWSQDFITGQTSNANKPNVDYGLPGVSNDLFTTSGEPKMLCLGGRWIGTSPYGSIDSSNMKLHCVGGILTPDPNHSSESFTNYD